MQLAQEKNSQFTCFKKYIARKLTFTYGRLNGDAKLSLAVAQAIIKQVHATLICKSAKHALTDKTVIRECIPSVFLGVKNCLVVLTFPHPEPIPKKFCDSYWLQLRIAQATKTILRQQI